MRPKKGTTPLDDRWRSRRLAAFILRAAIFLVPLGVGFAAGRTVAGMLTETESAADIAFWWVAVLVAATSAATLTDRLARRLLPLTILLKMTMLFPDRAPSRMRVALRAGNFTELRKRIDRVQSGESTDIGEMSELILSLSTALSHHDRKTRGHSERTRAYTDILSEEMGLGEEARDKLRWAALLHDVGKLEVPTEILNKDSKLTDEEWHIVRQHPVYGMKLVGPLIPWLGEWAKTIEHHHERFDGTGYPHGLAGTEIALGARIVSVGDAYDVMTSGRSYQRAKTPAMARQEIASQAGSQFDPLVVRALMNVSLGRLQVAAGPLAMLAELPFIRGLPQVGRDAATLLTSSALMATSMAAGVIPPPSAFLPVDVIDAVAAAGEFALPAEPDRASPEPQEPPTTGTVGPEDTSTTSSTTSTTTSTTAPSTTTTTTDGESTTTVTTSDGPRAEADTVSTPMGVPVVIDVLANDSDPTDSLDPSSLRLRSTPNRGAAVVASGRITYSPDPEEVGADSFRYRVCNRAGACAEATVTITITSVQRPPVVGVTAAAIDEDTLLSLALGLSDPDGDALTCSLAASPSSGAATVPADCSRLLFQPAKDFNGTVDIAIDVTDGTHDVTFTVIVTVRPVNDAPVTADDAGSTGWGSPLDVPVLANDIDVDGDTLTVTITSQPTSGSAAVVGSVVRYTPTIGAAGTFTIGYRACDPGGLCDDATVTVTVTAVTVTRDDAGDAAAGDAVVVRVVSNDVPGSGQWNRQSFRIVTQPAFGRAQTLGGGRIRYTPDDGFTGTDTVVYELCDTEGSCDTAIFAVTIG
jgi:HD-GYP domain-containing protein (c-di-GMP phosphodiesterase class II)